MKYFFQKDTSYSRGLKSSSQKSTFVHVRTLEICDRKCQAEKVKRLEQRCISAI